MNVLSDFLAKYNVNIDEIRKVFYGDTSGKNIEMKLDSIKASKSFIIVCSKCSETDVFDTVVDAYKGIEAGTSFTEYQKKMSKCSILLAWEELERENEDVCLELYNNAKKK